MRALQIIAWVLCGLSVLAAIGSAIFGNEAGQWIVAAVLFAAAATAYGGA